MGAIRIDLDGLQAADPRRRSCGNRVPLGRLLRDGGVDYRSRPTGFLAVTPNSEMMGVFWMREPRVALRPPDRDEHRRPQGRRHRGDPAPCLTPRSRAPPHAPRPVPRDRRRGRRALQPLLPLHGGGRARALARGGPEHPRRGTPRSAGRASTRPSTTTARCASRTSSRSGSASSRSRSGPSATPACCRGARRRIATGRFTIACASRRPNEPMRGDRHPPRDPGAPRGGAGRRGAAAAAAVSTASCSRRRRRSRARRSGRCRERSSAALLRPAPRARTASTRASSRRPACSTDDAALPARPGAAAAHDQGRARRRSGGEPALGHGAHRAARALHALLPDVLHHRPAAALDRHQRELAVAARVLEGRVPRRARRPGRPHLLSVLVRALPRLLGGLRRGLADRRSTASRAAACRASCGSRLIESLGVDRRLLHADLRAAPGRRWRRARASGSARAACAS